MKLVLIIKITLVLFVVFSLVLVNSVDAYVNVKGYTKKDGTYVAPYVRSNPNGLKSDNYGYTPSQGTYNKTYGTRGSSWDTQLLSLTHITIKARVFMNQEQYLYLPEL